MSPQSITRRAANAIYTTPRIDEPVMLRVEPAVVGAATHLVDVVHGPPDAILWEGDPETLRFTFVSRSAVDILGYQLEQWSEPAFWVDHLHPNDRDETIAARAEATAAGRDHNLVYRMVHADGHAVSLRDRVRVVRSPEGQVDYLGGLMIDITDSKLAEVALRESEQRYQDLLEALGVAVYTTDATGRITFFNEAAAHLWGRRPELGKDEWCGSWRLYWPDGTTMAHDECPMAVTLKENRPVRGAEAIAERPDGSRVFFLPFPTPLREPSGALTGAVNVLVDVTARMEAEQALKDREGQLSAMVAQTAVGIAQCDISGRFLLVNQRFCEMVGRTADELHGMSMQDITHPGDLLESGRLLRSLLEGTCSEFAVDKRYMRPDDSLVWSSTNVSVIRDGKGGVRATLAACVDITERRLVEEALRQSREEMQRRLKEEQAVNQLAELLRASLDLETVCEASLDSVMRIMDLEFGFIAVRRGDEAHVAASRGVARQSLAAFRVTTRKSRTLLADALFSGKAAFSPPKRLPEGSRGYMRDLFVRRVAALPLTAHGSVVGALEVAGRGKGAWSLENRRFLRRIADIIALALANAQSYEELGKAFRERDEGVRAIAHEVRTPLTAIKGFAQLALHHIEQGQPRPERIKDQLHEIDAASERLARVASQMLGASSIEAGLRRLQREDVSIGSLLRDAVAEFGSEETPCRVRLEQRIRGSLRCDPQLIRQVLWNLLRNAVQHSQSGDDVIVRALRRNGDAIISVSDRGPGIRRHHRRRLFDKFFRGTNGNGQGLGLGLYLARQVVEAHGGKIWYEPTAPHGATFSFSMPIRRKARGGGAVSDE